MSGGIKGKKKKNKDNDFKKVKEEKKEEKKETPKGLYLDEEMLLNNEDLFREYSKI